jgi:hypothetical protein
LLSSYSLEAAKEELVKPLIKASFAEGKQVVSVWNK